MTYIKGEGMYQGKVYDLVMKIKLQVIEITKKSTLVIINMIEVI